MDDVIFPLVAAGGRGETKHRVDDEATQHIISPATTVGD
jgi:hypothetical protein